MRKYITLLSMLIFMTVYGHAQNSGNKYYYYYKAEKQFLELNTDFAFVTVTGDEAKNANLFRVGEGTLKKEGLSDKMKQKLNLSEDFYWTEIKFGENTNSTIYNEKVAALKQSRNLQTVSPYFKSANSKKIGLTNFFYVKLKTTADIALLEQYAKQTNSIIVKQDDFMSLWYVLSCTKSSDRNSLELANQFFESGLFQFAEPDLMLEDILNCVNDTYFPQQWGLRNTGQYGGTAGMDIRACDAWNLSTGTNINVAVVDEGIQLDHPDLQTNIHSLSYDGENGSSPSIVRGDHGTACAGIIGAVGNTAGIRGVAPNCSLMSVSNIMNTGTPNIKQKLASSINWAVQNGAHILSNSWGNNLLSSSLIDDAISNALTNGRNGLGCVVVFATGNDNGAVQYPANSNPNILAVGAMSPCGQRKSPTSCDNENTWGSNFGVTLDVVAPGVLIPTTDRTSTNGYNPNIPIHTQNNGNRILTDYTNNDYTVWFNGTSSACPHVAGVAALILSVNPSLTGQQVRDIIEQTAQKVGGYNYTTTTGRTNGIWHNEMGYGLVNALCSVTRAQMSLATLSGSSLVCSSGAQFTVNNPSGATVSWTCSGNVTFDHQTGNPKTFTATGNGTGTIQAILITACGNVALPVKNVSTGSLIPIISGPYNVHCGYTVPFVLDDMSKAYGTSFYWSSDILSISDPYSVDCSAWATFDGSGYISCRVTTCGVSNTSTRNVVVNTCDYLLLSPNPSFGEISVSIESASKESVSITADWDLEVFDSSQLLKVKKGGIKTKNTTINTSGWKDGAYIVRAKYKGNTLIEKLIVQH